MKNGNIFHYPFYIFPACIFSIIYCVYYRAMEFRDQVESKGLAAVATELSETVTDPKIQATEVNETGCALIRRVMNTLSCLQFMDYVRKLGKGDLAGGEVKGQSTDASWAEEFSGTKEEVEDMGYWGQLEKEWQELAK